MPVEDSAAVVAASRGVVLPVVSEASGLAAIDALAAGVPVIASAVGALPEIVGTAGILVEPRDPDRLAAALAAAWSDDPVRAGIAAAARERSADGARTWADVAADVAGDLRGGRPARLTGRPIRTAREAFADRVRAPRRAPAGTSGCTSAPCRP